MFFNIIIGFVMPWIFVIILYFNDKRVLVTSAFFESTLAYTINALGFHFGLWDIVPLGQKELSHVPFDMGLYPALASWMIYFIRSTKTNAFTIIIIFTTVTTLIEGVGVMTDRIFYSNGWNIGWTYISYLIPYLLCYRYYLCLNNLGVFEPNN